MQMKWTTERPTVHGHYWVVPITKPGANHLGFWCDLGVSEALNIVKVEQADAFSPGLSVYDCDGDEIDVDSLPPAYWSGPILEPEPLCVAA